MQLRSSGPSPRIARPSMPFLPSQIWKRLSPELQRRITDELSSILQEVLYEQIRTGEPSASATQGTHLHPTVNSSPGAHQSRDPAAAVCAPATRPAPGLKDLVHLA